jgi:hypothetical protein
MTEPFGSIGYELAYAGEAVIDGAENVANDRAK